MSTLPIGVTGKTEHQTHDSNWHLCETKISIKSLTWDLESEKTLAKICVRLYICKRCFHGVHLLIDVYDLVSVCKGVYHGGEDFLGVIISFCLNISIVAYK